MPFTDAQLSAQMQTLLVSQGVMTNAEQTTLLGDPREHNVQENLDDEQLANFKSGYWPALGNWMAAQGGNIQATTGRNVPGRQGGNPSGIGNIALYNDAFNDVNKNIGGANFKPVKAVSAQLRFIKAYG